MRIRFFSLNTIARSWYLYDMPQIPCMESSYTLSSVCPHSVLPSDSPPRPMITPSMLCSMLGRTITSSTFSTCARSDDSRRRLSRGYGEDASKYWFQSTTALTPPTAISVIAL